MSGGIPSGAVGFSVAVLVYSFISLFFGCLLFYLGWRHGASFSYTSLIAIFSSLACVASISQQIHYATRWESIKQAEYAAKVLDPYNPILVVTGATQGVDLGLFWIQFTTYNINSLLILFWATSLFLGTWQFKFYANVEYRSPRYELAGKLFSIFFPALQFGLAHIPAVSSRPVPYLLMCNLSLSISLLVGSVLLALTLYKLVASKKLFNSVSGSGSGSAGRQELSRMRRSDKLIILRFSIAFSILAVFEVSVVCFQVLQYIANTSTTLEDVSAAPLSATITQLAQFIPGVSPPLVAYLVWGTTKTYSREIRRLARGCCCGRRRRSFGAPSPPPVAPKAAAAAAHVRRHSTESQLELHAAATELVELGGTARGPPGYKRWEVGG